MSVWKGRGGGVEGSRGGANLPQVHSNFVSGWVGWSVGVSRVKQAIITGKVSTVRGGVGGARKPGTRCSFGSKKELSENIPNFLLFSKCRNRSRCTSQK